MTRREFYKNICRLAQPIYGTREAAQIAQIILDEVVGVSHTELIVRPDVECAISDSQARRIEDEVEAGRPVQYIVGRADFCDMRLAVREGVLIPRPESEELVRWICEECDEHFSGRLLDIGTGSGALAIALAVARPNLRTIALDVSNKAITIAQENIMEYAPRVTLVEGDALKGVENYVDGEFDIVVSNPPYIPQREQSAMCINVTNYEPHLALFVPDDDPLIFYRTIAQSSQKILSPKGRLYLEIHENFATKTKEMLHTQGYKKVTIRHDINDKARMICAQKEL